LLLKEENIALLQVAIFAFALAFLFWIVYIRIYASEGEALGAESEYDGTKRARLEVKRLA
jgi:hypothetical protein